MFKKKKEKKKDQLTEDEYKRLGMVYFLIWVRFPLGFQGYVSGYNRQNIDIF